MTSMRAPTQYSSIGPCYSSQINPAVPSPCAHPHPSSAVPPCPALTLVLPRWASSCGCGLKSWGSPSSHPAEIPKLKRPKGDINSWHPRSRGIDVMCCKGLVHVCHKERGRRGEGSGGPGWVTEIKEGRRERLDSAVDSHTTNS